MSSQEANVTSSLPSLHPNPGFITLLACNLLSALPANIYVMWLILGKAGGAWVSEIFALNLSLSEVLFSLPCLHLILYFSLGWDMVQELVLLQLFLRLMFIARPLFQSCICLERYLAVVHPHLFLRLKPLRYRLMFCVTNWLLVLVLSLIPTFMFSIKQSAVLLICCSFVFLVLMTYGGIHVLCALTRPPPGQDNRSLSITKRTAFKVIMITLTFTSMAQIVQVLLLGPTMLNTQGKVAMWATMVNMTFSIVSGVITPLVFLQRAGKLSCFKLGVPFSC